MSGGPPKRHSEKGHFILGKGNFYPEKGLSFGFGNGGGGHLIYCINIVMVTRLHLYHFMSSYVFIQHVKKKKITIGLLALITFTIM